MEAFGQIFSEIQNDVPWANLFLALLLVALGQVFLKGLDQVIHLVTKNQKSQRPVLAARKFFVYFFNFMLFLLVLKLIKVDMKVILGATGLLTIAVGFAARAPLSNLVGGLFLFFDGPFAVGDLVEVDGHKGEVVSQNLLSLTLRTLDNLLVRVPNEVVIGKVLTNTTAFPIRCLEIQYPISNKDSLTRLEEILKEVAFRNGLALNEPEPFFYVRAFRENYIEAVFKVWCPVSDYYPFLSQFPKEVHRAVKAAGMEPISQNIRWERPMMKRASDSL